MIRLMSRKKTHKGIILLLLVFLLTVCIICGIVYWRDVKNADPASMVFTVSAEGKLYKISAADAIEESGILKAGSTVQTTYRVEADRIIFTMGTAGTAVDTTKLAEQLEAAAAKRRYKKVIACPMTDGVVEPVDIDRIYREVFQEAIDASLDPDDDYKIVESATGLAFDKEEASHMLADAEEGSTVVVPLVHTEPQITTQDLKEYLFRDLLASYTTKVTGTSGRMTNVRLASDSCDGAVLLAGEEFSFNDAVGEQTEETGFQKANGILNGEIVQVYGGGICQVSSTIFAAALYAGLEISERWNHDLAPRYIPAGMDAAVSWDVLDFRIANNTEYPLKMEVIYTDGYLTVNILGTKTDGTIIEIETEPVDSSNGYREVETYRKNYNEDKSQVFIEQVAYSVYLR